MFCSVLFFFFFGHEAHEILAPRPGTEPASPVLEGEVVTTGPPGKVPVVSLFDGRDSRQWIHLCGLVRYQSSPSHLPYSVSDSTIHSLSCSSQKSGSHSSLPFLPPHTENLSPSSNSASKVCLPSAIFLFLPGLIPASIISHVDKCTGLPKARIHMLWLIPP